MFKEFLESYIDVCSNIVTEEANSALMFEAGEEAAINTKTLKIEDFNREFEKDGVSASIEISGKKVTFHVKGLPITGNKCRLNLTQAALAAYAKAAKEASPCLQELENQLPLPVPE